MSTSYVWSGDPRGVMVMAKNAEVQQDEAGNTKDEEEEEADEENEGEESGSDDPDRLWCICQKPHDDRYNGQSRLVKGGGWVQCERCGCYSKHHVMQCYAMHGTVLHCYLSYRALNTFIILVHRKCNSEC